MPKLNMIPKICVVVPVFNRKKMTLRFIENFLKSTYNHFEIVIVDDNSADGTVEAIRNKYAEIKIIEGTGDLWWSGATNRGVRYAMENGFDYVMTINDDAIVDANYLKAIVDCAIQYPDSIIGSVLTDETEKTVWSLGAYLDWSSNMLFNLNHSNENVSILKNLDSPLKAQLLNGDGTLIPIGVFSKIGLYDEKWCPQYHGDSDFVYRAGLVGIEAFICLEALLINDLDGKKALAGYSEVVFNKRSDFYWKPLFKFYMKFAPLKYKIFFFKQYYRIFPDALLFRIVRKLHGLFIRPFTN